MLNLKMLLYCTKVKPYLQFNPVDSTFRLIDRNFNKLNCKIVAECNYEVEKIIHTYENKGATYHHFNTKTLDNEQLLRKSCIIGQSIDEYLGNRQYDKNNNVVGYAIHVKNLYIFEKPKELSECDQVNNCCFEKEADKLDWEGLPIFFCAFTNVCKYQSDGQTCDKSFFPLKHIHNMSEVYDKQDYKFKYIISITPQEACNILNHKQDILIRKNVLKEMIPCK